MAAHHVISVIIILICCFGLLLQPALSQDVRLPPKMVLQPIEQKYFRPGDEVVLKCGAIGQPVPTYEWWKNGAQLGPRDNIQYISEGVISINPLTVMDDGYYQCRAVNMYGTSLSRVTVLQRAVLDRSPSSEPQEMTGLLEGDPLTIPCHYRKCFPKPSFSWAMATSTIDLAPRGVVRNKRVQIDDDGNLHFSYLMTGDERDDRLYKCLVLNPYLDVTVGGSYTRLHITPQGGPKNFGPIKAFSSDQSVVALEGRPTSLRCFFNGYPDPTITWSRSDGKQMPIGRYRLLNYNTELAIESVEKSDEGDYKCEGKNMNGQDNVIMQIDVQWEPKFASPEDRMGSVNVTEGDELRLPCRVTAEPVATIVWMQNGVPLDPSNMPSRMRVNGDELILENVCKNCKDRESDLQVIQCNASNVHGYVFIDAYVNVLERTVITDVPQSVHLAYDDTSAEFHCAAAGDDAVPVTISWYHVSSEDNKRLVVNETGRVNVTVSADGTLLSIHVRANDSAGWLRVGGKYHCVASNGYSNQTSEVVLDVEPMPTAPVAATSPQTGGLVGAGVADMWWLLVIIAVILLILILVCCCVFCCKYCKGDTYFVDKKEKRDHRDPEKELKDSALQPYHRPDLGPLKGGTGSLGGSIKGDSDDDEESLMEYGDIDAGKFTEDGSFIGDYHSEQRNRGTDSYA